MWVCVCEGREVVDVSFAYVRDGLEESLEEVQDESACSFANRTRREPEDKRGAERRVFK